MQDELIGLPDLKFEIIYDNKAYPLRQAPIGWDKYEVVGDIDDTYKVIWEKVNSELKFDFEGGIILRDIYFSQGPTAVAYLRVSKKDINTWAYKEMAPIAFDFQKASYMNEVFTCGMLESDAAANIRAFQDVKYSIPVEENAVNMNIGGIGVDESVRYIAGPTETGPGSGFIFIPSVDITDDTTSDIIVTTNSGFDSFRGNFGDDFDDAYEFRGESAVTFDGRIVGSVTVSDTNAFPFTGLTFKASFLILDSTGVKYYIKKNLYTQKIDEGRKIITLDFDFNIQIVDGRNYAFTIEFLESHVARVDSLDLKLSYQVYTDDYTVKGLRSLDLLKALLAKINPDIPVILNAPVLETGLGNRLVIASGDCIRGIPGATIQTSLRDFMKGVGVQLFSGFKLFKDNTAKFDKLTQFFNKFLPAGDIGEVKDAKYETIQEAFCSRIIVGYDDNDYDKANGKNEFNTEEERTVEGSKSTATMEIKSVYRADARGVDQLLIDYIADPTRDNTGDKQVFQFVINEEPNEEDNLYHLTGPEIYAKVEGTSALGRIYNLLLSPREMLLRNSALLAVQFAITKVGTILFQSSKKDAALKITTFDGQVYTEKDPITVQQMDDPLYLPIKCTFTVNITDNIYNNVISSAEKSGGFIKFKDKGEYREGFVVSYTFNETGDNIKEVVTYLTPNSGLPGIKKIT